ncbi:CHAT domain-containing protein [Sphingomonas sp. PP-CE-3G-477]|nr:CHAT domain-containing protein [Sphingomonas sp. PP-CE-3G-477]
MPRSMPRTYKALMMMALGSSALAGCATVTPQARLETVGLGRNPAGEACIATRNWSDPGVPDRFARAYTIACSGVAASRPLGTVRAIKATAEAQAALDAQFDCGPVQAVRVAATEGTARRCLDRITGLESVRLDTARGGMHYAAAGTPALLPLLEEALGIVSGVLPPNTDVTRTPTATIDIARLAARPSATGADLAAADAAGTIAAPLDVATALAQGISLNHKGLYVEASRILNDALSRLSPTASAPSSTTTTALLSAELLLEAALADSNIRFPDAAAAHFAAADAIFVAQPASRTAFLSRKRDTYVALDAINRHAFPEALATLDRVSNAPAAAGQPLRDPSTLRLLNQPRQNGTATALTVPNAAVLSQLVLDIQTQYGRSVALLAQGDRDQAEAAIDRAAAIYRPLANERLDQTQLLWLGARIARQRGRLQAQRGDYADAYDNFTDAVDMLRRSAIANAGTGNEPAIAEAQLDRAAVYARTGASRTAVRNAFGEAVDALIDSHGTSLGSALGMQDYLDLLVAESAKPLPDTYDRFFRAVQANGEPAVARQLSQLRTTVTADGTIATALRERADLEREITRLRYTLAGGKTDEAAPTDLSRARTAAEQRLLAVDAQLAADPRYRTLDDAPATLVELRAALRPGEAFLKLTRLDRRIYGLVVTPDRTFVYHVADSGAATRAIETLGQQLRASIDGGLDVGKLVPFDEARAYTLFRLVAGPAAPTLQASRSIVVDPAGPLETLPIGALVTRYDANEVRADPFDFSQTAFLARTASISNALSPRSFLVARGTPASRAQRAFIGFGQHSAPASATGVAALRPISVGYGCSVDYGRLASLSRTLKPISARELSIAAGALQVRDAQLLTGAAFTDTSVEARGDLDQYEVVHFATHGLTEGMWGCSKSPPALVTSFGDAKSDGLLSFSEIAQLRLDANLVVLSACDTAAGVRDEGLARSSGQEEAGATLEGLVRAFLTANARAVLATYWQVSAEKESDEFIRAFYARARTGTMGEAMQDAQRALIAQPAYSHPFYWAPYFLVGDSSKTALTTASPAQSPRVAAK